MSEEELAKNVLNQMKDDNTSDIGEEVSDDDNGLLNFFGVKDDTITDTRSEGAAGDIKSLEEFGDNTNSNNTNEKKNKKRRTKDDTDTPSTSKLNLQDLIQDSQFSKEDEEDEIEKLKRENLRLRMEASGLLRKRAEPEPKSESNDKTSRGEKKILENKSVSGQNNTNERTGLDNAQVQNQLLPVNQNNEKRTTQGNSIVNHFDLDEEEFGIEKFTYVSGDGKRKTDMSVQLNNGRNLNVNYLASRTVEQFKKMSGAKDANDYANSIKNVAMRMPVPVVLLMYQGFKKYRVDDIEKGDELVNENNRKSRDRTGRNDAVPQITYKSNWETLKPYLIILQGKAQGRLTWSAIAICYEVVFKSIRNDCLDIIPGQQRALYSKAYFVGTKVSDAIEECDLRLKLTAAILGKFFSTYKLSSDEISAIENPGAAFIPSRIGTASDDVANKLRKISIYNLKDTAMVVAFVNNQNVVDLIPALFLLDIKNISSIKEFKMSMSDVTKTKMFNYFQKIVRIAERIMNKNYNSKVFDRNSTWEEVKGVYWNGMNILRKIIRGLKRASSNRMRNNPRATTAAFNTASKASGGRDEIDDIFRKF